MSDIFEDIVERVLKRESDEREKIRADREKMENELLKTENELERELKEQAKHASNVDTLLNHAHTLRTKIADATPVATGYHRQNEGACAKPLDEYPTHQSRPALRNPFYEDETETMRVVFEDELAYAIQLSKLEDEEKKKEQQKLAQRVHRRLSTSASMSVYDEEIIRKMLEDNYIHAIQQSKLEDENRQRSKSPAPLQRSKSPAPRQRSKSPAPRQKICSVAFCENIPDEKLQCGHYICTDDFYRMTRVGSKKCPQCRYIFGTCTGNSPDGTMRYKLLDKCLSAYDDGSRTIAIYYDIPDGVRDDLNGGKQYIGRHDTAYLPSSPDGFTVLAMLQVAFSRGNTFTYDRSFSRGEDAVVWNGIHHKTSLIYDDDFGYPDSGYLKRVETELAQFGITPDNCGVVREGVVRWTYSK